MYTYIHTYICAHNVRVFDTRFNQGFHKNAYSRCSRLESTISLRSWSR